jgi:hypothetical protein
MKTTTNKLLGVGSILALVLVLGCTSDALALHMPPPPPPPHHPHHGGPGWGGGHGSFGFVVAPRPSGYYQTITETVMVQAETVEQYWVPAVYNTVTDASGNPQTVLVREGYMASRIIPAQYTTVTRQVWVPCGGPSVGLGFGIRF